MSSGNFLALPAQTDAASEGCSRPGAPSSLRPSFFLAGLILITRVSVFSSRLYVAMSYVKSNASVLVTVLALQKLTVRQNKSWQSDNFGPDGTTEYREVGRVG